MTLSRRLLFTAVLTLIGVSALTTMIEGGIRYEESSANLVFPDNSPGLKYAFRPGGTENSFGFNEREVPQTKTPGQFRIAVLGDSVTHGAMVPADQAYPRVAEQRLQAAGYSNVQVLNFAVYGYDIESIEALARDQMSQWAPDLLVYGFFTNDAIPTQIVSIEPGTHLFGENNEAHGYPVWVGTIPRPFVVLSPDVDPWLHGKSALFRRWEGAVADRALAAHQDKQLSKWDWYEEHYRGLVAASQALKIPLITYLIPPHVFVQPDMESCNEAAAKALKFCEQNFEIMSQALMIAQRDGGIPYDGGAAYKSGPVTDLHGSPDDPHHPNAEGHRRLGNYLAGVLAQYLPGARP